MSKIVLDTIASGYNLAKINDNFTKIAAALNDEVLYRDVPSGETNTVKNDIDMDSNDLLNVGDLRVLGTATIEGINFDDVNSALVWRGAWNSSSSYAISDAVSHNGSSYISIAASLNSAPPSASWELLAQQGSSGVGTGDVTGPASSTSGAVAVFASGTGKSLSDSGVLISTLAVKGPLASSGITGAAGAGVNSDITSLIGLTTAISGTALGDKIQPITASVVANALTITLNPTTLDFRSATLSSGTVNTRRINTAISLTISSGSTLGTVSAQQSRIAVLAIDNAGTVELAAVNIAGGNDLSEAGLITTTAEGGAGAADTANVIYSTTARTSVPYRVVGYVESTQATAGTWATAPSTIQGYGGQAFAAMSSLGYGARGLSAGRSLGTTYYNTTGRPMFVEIIFTGHAVSAGATLVVDGSTRQSNFSPVSSQAGLTICTIVGPNSSYAAITSGSVSLTSWKETT